jgi:hypothetical protein
MDLQNVALAGYRAANPMNGGFPDDHSKNAWLLIAKAILEYKPSILMSSKVFIAEAIALCEATYSTGSFKDKPKESVLALADLYHKLHVKLNAEAFYMYACAANCVLKSIFSDNKDLLNPLSNLLKLPIEITETIKSFPKLNSKGETTAFAGGYATLRVLDDSERYLNRCKSSWSYKNNYGCSMCRAHVSHFLCDGV